MGWRLLLQIVKIRVATPDVGEELALFRRVGGSGELRVRFDAEGLEAVEFLGDLANGALEAVDHAADAVEEGGFTFERIAEGGSILHGGGPDFGFGILETVEAPEVHDELVDALLLGSVPGTTGVLLKLLEGFEFLGIFAGDDERFGMDAVFDGVQANGGFPFGRGRSGREERIGAICCYLCW